MPAAKKPPALPVAESFQQIQDADKRAEATVQCPEWGLAVQVRSLSRGEVAALYEGLEELEASALEKGLQIQDRALLAGVVSPPIGEGDVARLRDLDGGAVNRISERILELSGETDGQVDADAKRFPAAE